MIGWGFCDDSGLALGVDFGWDGAFRIGAKIEAEDYLVSGSEMQYGSRWSRINLFRPDRRSPHLIRGFSPLPVPRRVCSIRKLSTLGQHIASTSPTLGARPYVIHVTHVLHRVSPDPIANPNSKTSETSRFL
jgi:hypothetical protein